MKLIKKLWLLAAIIAVNIACSDSDDERVIENYDPNKEVIIKNFFPDSGGIATKMIIEGVNFGSDTSKIDVRFNEKKAAVITAQGDKMYVLAPKLPGDTCVIKVRIGDQEVTADKEFRYLTQMTVSTVAGSNGANGGKFLEGSLATAAFGNIRGTAADKYGNVFLSMYVSGGSIGVCRVDIPNNQVTWVSDIIGNGVAWNSPAVHSETQAIWFPSNSGQMVLVLDPLNLWMPRAYTIKRPSAEQIEQGMVDFNIADIGTMHSLAYNPKDNKFYTRCYNGRFLSIDAETFTGQILGNKVLDDNISVDSYAGIDPTDGEWLYFSYYQRHFVRRLNLKTLEFENYAGTRSQVGSWRDGIGDDAEFKNPRCIIFDSEGSLYVADMGNHCIRKVTKERVVSTVTGKPGSTGTTDGSPDKALFNNPFGIGVDHEGNVYIGEAAPNRMLRKLTME